MQGLVFSVHNDHVLARDDTRELAREWLVDNVPMRSKVVVEPVVPDAWAQDTGPSARGTGNGNRWIKWPTSRRADELRRRPGVIQLEDYERTRGPSWSAPTRAAASAGWSRARPSTAAPRPSPTRCPTRSRYYAELERRGDLVYQVSPYGAGEPIPFSFDFSFNCYPLRLRPARARRSASTGWHGGRCGAVALTYTAGRVTRS